MSAPLCLVSLKPDMKALSALAAEAGYVGRDGDLGYALHAALLGLFGPELAPKPFALRQGQCLGYASATPGDLDLAARLPGLERDALARALRPHSLEVRAMPTDWRVGHVLDAEVRIRPIVRSRAKSGRASRPVELDFFVEGSPAHSTDDPRSTMERREAAYAGWLAAQCDRLGGCSIGAARMTAFRRSRLLTRSKAEAGRKPVSIEGPDATFVTRVTITDPARFSEQLRRGIGRHRAFGYGMMLLAPAGRLLPTGS